MRLWTLHPKHLDRQGLVALWRESLLALKVLRGQTKGYRNHPQLNRFRNSGRPVTCLAEYLRAVLREADARGYNFDAGKIPRTAREIRKLTATAGQLEYEWQHLDRKLKARSPALRRSSRGARPVPHPLFRVVPGPISEWERPSSASSPEPRS